MPSSLTIKDALSELQGDQQFTAAQAKSAAAAVSMFLIIRDELNGHAVPNRDAVAATLTAGIFSGSD